MTEMQNSTPMSFPSEKLNQLLSDNYRLECILKDLLLYTKPSDQALIVSFLQRFSKSELTFYLPQLIHLSFVFPSYCGYSNLFHDLAVDDHNLAIKIFWLMGTYLDNPEFRGINKYLLKLENCIINGRSPQHNEEPMSLYEIQALEDDINFRKLIREDYFERQKRFVGMLMQVATQLVEREEFVESFLSNSLLEVDQFLSKLRKRYSPALDNNYTARLYRGIVLPLEFGEYNEQVVRILPIESYCLRTSTRIPYLLVAETIDLNEISKERSEVMGKVSSLESLKEKKLEKRNTWSNSSSFCNERWEEKLERLRRASPFGNYKTWTVRGVIVKNGDDLRQEHLAMQVIKKCLEVFQNESLNLFLRPYNIIVVSSKSGIIEFIPDTHSIHSLKQHFSTFESLLEIFKHVWGTKFDEAQMNFVQSMAGYSLVSYILNLKDRHNGNILIDSEGHLIHIDFGFFLTSSPGGNFGFESAPFKLTKEMIDLMGGYGSNTYVYFTMLVSQGFVALRKFVDELSLLVEIMEIGSDFQCFVDRESAVKEFRERFWLGMSETECLDRVLGLIDDAADSWRTNQYDFFQKGANNILS